MKASRLVEYTLAVYLVICPWIAIVLHWTYGFSQEEATSIIVAGAISGSGLFILSMLIWETEVGD